MTGYKRGDVVLLPFPFTDLSTLKQRPALVLSSDKFNLSNPDIVVAAITSQIPKGTTPSDFVLSASDIKACGLPKASLIKLGKIVTLDKRLIRKKLGSLPASSFQEVVNSLRQVFGIE
jgi:mRNA interferase MazF